jgi:hypothetical protein
MAWTKAKMAILTGAGVLLAVGSTAVAVKEIQKAHPDGAPVVMKVTWEVGKRYVMRMEMTSSSDAQEANQRRPMKQSMKTTEDITLSVLKELEDGGRQMEMEFKSVGLEITESGRPVLRASSSRDAVPDPANPVSPVLRKIAGARIQFTLDASGELVQMSGYEEFIKRLQPMQPEVQSYIEGYFGTNVLQQYPHSMKQIIPNRPVRPGDTWSRNEEAPGPGGKLSVHLDFTFEKWEQHAGRNCMRIRCKGNFSSKALPSRSPDSVKLEKCTASGVTWFDPDLGTVVESTIDQDIRGSIDQGRRALTSQQHTHSTLLSVESFDP